MKKKIIKLKSQITAIILCGGKGNRLRPITKFIPKPLVKIKNKEILFYIIKHLFFYNIKDCILAGGYKSNLLQKYAKNKKVSVINTGLNADIIQRIKDDGGAVSNPPLKTTGGGFSRYGHLRVHWAREEKIQNQR